MKDFIAYLISPFVENVEDLDIEVREVEDGQTEVMVYVPSEEMGKVIGKGGKTVSSLRQIVRLYGHIHNEQILFKVEDKPTGDEA